MKNRNKRPTLNAVKRRKLLKKLPANKRPTFRHVDPTLTYTLRRAFSARVKNAFGRLKSAVFQAIEREDSLGLLLDTLSKAPVRNANWRFMSSPQKVEAFRRWLRQQLTSLVAGKSQEELWRAYVEQGFRKGAGRAFDDAKVAERAISYGGKEKLDFYNGTREDFLKSAFGRPVAVEKVKLLTGRAFDELNGVTEQMATRMTRVLADGLVQGKGPRDVARDLSNEIDIGRDRAEVIARTEIIRAHAEGQLEALDQLGVEEVGVAVEWATAGDDKVCELCEPLEGVVMKLDEARGMLPRHPNCRCAWIPANVGGDRAETKHGAGAIRGAIRDSLDKQGAKAGWGPAMPVEKSRPESIFTPPARNALAILSQYVSAQADDQ